MIKVDIVHGAPAVAETLGRAFRRQPSTVAGTIVHSWSEFQREWDFAAAGVVLDAELADHVPLVLKVRALHRLGTRSVVIGSGRSTLHAARARAEGAADWIEPTASVEQTVRSVSMALTGPSPVGTAHQPPVAHLTDRQLQVLAMYVSRRAASVQEIAAVLGLSSQTVRSTLTRGRALFRAKGVDTSSRERLRRAMVADGWVSDQQFFSRASLTPGPSQEQPPQ